MDKIMKARVKVTGEIVEVVSNGLYYESIKDERIFDKSELEIMPKTKGLDYWTRLEHQYAGMAMQGLVARGEVLGSSVQEIARDIAEISCEVAHALIQKLKEKAVK